MSYLSLALEKLAKFSSGYFLARPIDFHFTLFSHTRTHLPHSTDVIVVHAC